QSRDHGADFFMAKHLVVAGFFNVEDLTLERQNCLEAAVAALFGGASGGFALYQEQLAALRIALLAIGQLVRHAAGFERALSPCEVASMAGGLPRARGVDCLA